MVKLTPYLNDIVPDPIRHWIKLDKELGAEHMFTIGVPDPIPAEVLEIYSKAAYNEDVSGKTSYTPVAGEDVFKRAVVRVEQNFNVKYSEEDAERIYPTVGASQALQFAFSLFAPGSEVIVMAPAWGTIYNMIAHSGNRGVPCRLFGGGGFLEETPKRALTEGTQAVYINSPSNPTGVTLSEKQVRGVSEWAASHNLQIISDSPYKYLLHNPEGVRYASPLNFGEDLSRRTIEISSFSKVIKPDIRLGYIRLSPEIIESDKNKRVLYMFRNLGAGTSRAIQKGVTAVIAFDPELKFLRPVADGYREKAELMLSCLQKMGCGVDEKPNAAYLLFPKTPGGEDSEEFVKRMARDHKIGFIPGTSFGGGFRGFEYLNKNFRAGIGGGLTKEKIAEVFDKIV